MWHGVAPTKGAAGGRRCCKNGLILDAGGVARLHRGGSGGAGGTVMRHVIAPPQMPPEPVMALH